MNDPGRRPRPGPEANRWTKVVIDSRPAAGEEIAVFLAELTGGGVEHAAEHEDHSREGRPADRPFAVVVIHDSHSWVARFDYRAIRLGDPPSRAGSPG